MKDQSLEMSIFWFKAISIQMFTQWGAANLPTSAFFDIFALFLFDVLSIATKWFSQLKPSETLSLSQSGVRNAHGMQCSFSCGLSGQGACSCIECSELGPTEFLQGWEAVEVGFDSRLIGGRQVWQALEGAWERQVVGFRLRGQDAAYPIVFWRHIHTYSKHQFWDTSHKRQFYQSINSNNQRLRGSLDGASFQHQMKDFRCSQCILL